MSRAIDLWNRSLQKVSSATFIGPSKNKQLFWKSTEKGTVSTTKLAADKLGG
jgi:hypothetical protein